MYMARSHYGTPYMGTAGQQNGANSPIGSWQHGYEGGAERKAMASPTLTSGSAHCTGKPRGSGWDSGRTKLHNPRFPPPCLPMPNSLEADGNSYGAITGWRGPSRPPSRVSVNLVPLLWTGFPTRHDKNSYR